MTMLDAQAGLYLAAGGLAAVWMSDPRGARRLPQATPASASTIR